MNPESYGQRFEAGTAELAYTWMLDSTRAVAIATSHPLIEKPLDLPTERI